MTWTDEAIEEVRLSLLHDHEIPAPTAIIGTILDLAKAIPPDPSKVVVNLSDYETLVEAAREHAQRLRWLGYPDMIAKAGEIDRAASVPTDVKGTT